MLNRWLFYFLGDKNNNISLKTKMQAMMFVMLIPLIVLIIYLIFRMGTYSNHYNSIYKNISEANEFSRDFKENYDSSMNLIVINSSSILFEREKVYDQLEKAEKHVKRLREITSSSNNIANTKDMTDYLMILKNKTTKIKESFDREGPRFDENMDILDEIYAVTANISTEIQSYVYYEASVMESVRQEIEHETKNTVKVAVAVFSVLLIFTFLMIELISSSITKPLKKLCVSAKKVGEGDFTTRVEGSNSDEIATLSLSFNSMIEKIGSLIEDVKIEQRNLRKTELKLMQAQINPHFLYNTLDTIIWLAEDNRNQDVVKMVSVLSKFFRITLSKGNDFITLKDEEMHVRSYLEIQQFRYQDILEYEVSIPKELGDCRILKLILQPIVENALYHGIKNKRGMGKITVQGSYENEMIMLSVKDNGIGIEEEKLEKIRRALNGENINVMEGKNGFGLANVNGRIQLNYGEKYGIKVNSNYGEGSEFIICIPAITDVPIDG